MAERQSQSEPSTAELLTRLSDQTTRLVQDEIALAKVELSEKAKSAGIGAGAFGAAGLLALYGVGALIAAAIFGLAEALPTWLSALIVAAVLFLIAGGAALFGKRKVSAATPPVPEEAIESVKLDVAEVKGARRS